MLAHLVLHYVGPSKHLEIELAPGLNLLTGDNGAGKTFLLDLAWWALTRTWVRAMARPWLVTKSKPRIEYKFESKVTVADTSASFDRERWDWRIPKGRPGNPGLVLYARVDGGFAVWDPARNARRRRDGSEELPRDPAYIFSPSEVWDGLFKSDVTLDGTQTRRSVCNGLIADWVAWQREGDARWTTLVEVLRDMSPPREPLEAAEPSSQDPDESRSVPTLRLYGRDVPITLASAGIRRVVALAYLLVWAWFEHQRQCELRGLRSTHQITFLVDEVEAHLHPKWQRVILRALRGVVDRLAQTQHAEVQVIAATHSPLVMASTEPIDRRTRCVVQAGGRRSGGHGPQARRHPARGCRQLAREGVRPRTGAIAGGRGGDRGGRGVDAGRARPRRALRYGRQDRSSAATGSRRDGRVVPLVGEAPHAHRSARAAVDPGAGLLGEQDR